MWQLRTFTSKATMCKNTARLIVHWAITGIAKGGQRLDETYFSWMGAVADDSPFYYRVQSPVVLNRV
jgi:hypothetical protein